MTKFDFFARRPPRVLTALLWACFWTVPAASGAGVAVLFDPADPAVGPFPTDFLAAADPSQKTGLRVQLPLPDCNEQPDACNELRFINELDGASLAARVTVRFSGPVDVETLREGIFFVALEEAGGRTGGVHSVGEVIGVNQLVYDPTRLTAFAKPNETLDQHRRYLLVVTAEVRDLEGDPVEPSPVFLECRDSPAGDYCSALSAALGRGLAPSQAVGASLFTTLSATAWLESVREQLPAVPVRFEPSSPGLLNLSGIAAVTLRLHRGLDPPSFEEITLPAPDLLLDRVGKAGFGSFESPRFLDERGVIANTPTGEPVPLPLETERIFFQAYLPDDDPPPGGYPVVIFGHGIGDSRFGGATGLAAMFARSDFATAAINAAGHGGGPRSAVEFLGIPAGRTAIPAPGRGADLDGDGVIGSAEGCLLLSPETPLVLRDCLRQTVVDLMQLVRAVREGVDFDGDGGNDLDPELIFYAGQSMGGIYGTMLMAVEPEITTAALNVAGGSVADIARWSPSFRSVGREFLADRTPPALNLEGNFNANFVLRNRPVRVNQVPGAIEIQDIFERIEWLEMTGDPLAFAAHLSAAPLAGVPSKNVLWQIARGDRTVPNPTNSALIRTARTPEPVSLYRHDLARAIEPDLSENPHVFLFDVFSPAGIAIALAGQRQLALYLASEGKSIPDVNAAPRLLLGRDVFETPEMLPEDLGFGFPLSNVSAASLDGGRLAPESIVTAFGESLADETAAAGAVPLPLKLGGASVRVTDRFGVEREAPIFFASPGQVNYLLPAGTATGRAFVAITNHAGLVSTAAIEVRSVAPSLFSANADGAGVAAAIAQRAAADGSQSFELVFSEGPPGMRTPAPVELGGEGDSVYLILFGTGLRAAGRAEVSVRIGGQQVPVLFAGAQGEFVGLDQVNVGPLPRELAGRGEVAIELRARGRAANVVTVAIR